MKEGQILARPQRKQPLSLFSSHPSAEKEQWAVATLMVEEQGDMVFDYLIARIKDLSAQGEHEGVRQWLGICNKVQRLADCDDGKSPN